MQIENPQQHIGIMGVIMFQIRKSCEYVFSGRYSVKSLHGVWVWPFSQKFLLYDQETCFTGISEELSCVCKTMDPGVHIFRLFFTLKMGTIGQNSGFHKVCKVFRMIHMTFFS